MANYDKGMEDRVWKRVRGEADESSQSRSPAANLTGLIHAELTAAAEYWALARRMGAKEAAILQKMSREERSHAQCLQGMYILITGQQPDTQPVQPNREPLETALRKCYHAELQSIAAYQSRSTDPEYGHIFASMALQEANHSRMILELLGGLGHSAGH